MINRKKKRLIVSIIISALLISCLSIGIGFASENQLRNELDDVESAQDEVSRKMAQVEKDIKSMQSKVDGLNYNINKTVNEIQTTQGKIEKKQKQMEEREKNLNQRLRVMYKNGSLGFVDVLLGSGSISEFVSNMEIIQKIYKNDVEIMETLKKEHEELVEIKASLNEKKKTLSAQKEELAVEKQKLNEKKKELEKEEDALKAEADRLTAEIVKLMDKNSSFVGGKFTWPVPSSRYITSSFGNRLHPILKVWKFHTGIDIGASSGKDILAATSGRVIMSKTYGGYGYCIMIDHGGGIVSLYGHCSKLIAKEGQIVKRGEVIAKVGSTGRSTGPHLHFEVRDNGNYVNPMEYF